MFFINEEDALREACNVFIRESPARKHKAGSKKHIKAEFLLTRCTLRITTPCGSAVVVPRSKVDAVWEARGVFVYDNAWCNHPLDNLHHMTPKEFFHCIERP